MNNCVSVGMEVQIEPAEGGDSENVDKYSVEAAARRGNCAPSGCEYKGIV